MGLSRKLRVDSVEVDKLALFLSERRMGLTMTLCVCSVAELLPFNQVQVDFAAVEVMEGLAFLHQQSLVHGALRPTNILLDHKGQVRLADVGLVAVLGNQAGRRVWEAQEVRKGSVHTRVSDIWDLGVVIVELANEGTLPYQYYRANSSTLLSTLSHHTVSPGCRRVVEACLQEEASLRPGIDQLRGYLEKQQDSAEGPSLVQIKSGANSDLLVNFMEEVKVKKGLLECSECCVPTEYSPVFLTVEDNFLCDSCMEGEHGQCEVEECWACGQLGEKLRSRWSRQVAIEQLRKEESTACSLSNGVILR